MNQSFIRSLFFLMLFSSMRTFAAIEFNFVGPDGNTLRYSASSATSATCVVLSPYKIVNSDVIIPEKVTYNGNEMSVSTIGKEAFRARTEITSVVIPGSVVRINDSAFSGAKMLSSVELNEGLQVIGESAFSVCPISEIDFPSTVVSIGASALSSTNIESVVLPDIEIIPRGLFYCCERLKSVIIPETVKEIEDNVFISCKKLKKIDIPSSVKIIDFGAFEYSGIEVLDLPDLESVNKENEIYECRHLTDITFRSINGGVCPTFVWCPSLKKVTFKEKLDIDYSAFKSCTSLQTVKAEKGVGTIRNKAFYGCVQLKNIEGLETATIVGDSAFVDCHSLKKVNFPNIIEEGIGIGTFYNCHSLEEATISGGCRGAGVSFENCYNLRTVDISGVVCDYSPPYCRNCYSLERIQIPEGSEIVNHYSFKNAYSLKFVEIPSTLRYIWDYAFDGSTEYNMFCHAITPPSPSSSSISINRFGSGDYHLGILHVYNDCVSAYESHKVWSRFTIIGDLAAYDVTSHDLVDGLEYDMPFSRENHTTTYTRNFKNTNWQAWFVPFDTKIEDYAGELEFAKVNNFFYKDGNTDTPYLNVAKVTSGIVEGSTPYLVRAKQAGEKVIRSVGKLYPAQTEYLTCTSMDTEFTFVGTYSGVSGEEMYENGYYAMTGGQIKYASSPNANLAPYRWYIKLTDRDGYEVSSFPRAIFISVDGEDTTDILDMYDTQSPTSDTLVYNLQGQCVGFSINGLKPGIYVSAGRKFVVR